jgi:hypothetical protein
MEIIQTFHDLPIKYKVGNNYTLLLYYTGYFIDYESPFKEDDFGETPPLRVIPRQNVYIPLNDSIYKRYNRWAIERFEDRFQLNHDENYGTFQAFKEKIHYENQSDVLISTFYGTLTTLGKTMMKLVNNKRQWLIPVSTLLYSYEPKSGKNIEITHSEDGCCIS